MKRKKAMDKRRMLALVLAGGLYSLAEPLRAQAGRPVPRVGLLSFGSPPGAQTRTRMPACAKD